MKRPVTVSVDRLVVPAAWKGDARSFTDRLAVELAARLAGGSTPPAADTPQSAAAGRAAGMIADRARGGGQ